jgi:hypothetical protein
MNNPLLTWYKRYWSPRLHHEEDGSMSYTDEILDLTEENTKLWRTLTNLLRTLVKQSMSVQLDEIPYLNTFMTPLEIVEVCFPDVYARGNISSSLISEENCRKMMEFSGGYIYEIGAGTGYNARVLSDFDPNATVYASDIHNGEFAGKPSFYDVANALNYEKMREVADAGGALLYIWPRNYFHLQQWIAMGGKKVMTIADNRPYTWGIDSNGEPWMDDGNPVCPIFPENTVTVTKGNTLIKVTWELVEEMDVPWYISEQEDKLRLFTGH